MASPLDPNSAQNADPFAQDPFAQDPLAQGQAGADPMMQPGAPGAADMGMGMPMVPTGSAVRKQRFSIYTMMLILAALCLGAASICLHMETKLYSDFKSPWGGANGAKAR